MSDIRSASSSLSGNDTAAVPAEASDVADIPAVVAIVVALNPGEEFVETLSSLGKQDYENLSVLVVDAGSDDPIADRVAEVLPEAYLHRLAGDPGWSVAANQSIELVSGSPFLLFCHDDVALAPDCVSQLMGELYRSNGGIAGPKLVRWTDERRLLQLGMGSDRFGVMVDQVERGEFDQDQYDGVRDVFVIPGGVQLIRADLFAALGGFDPTIKTMGEDLDLCWRAHAAGARVLVVPAARARHREAMKDRITPRERRRLLTRHRLRTLLATATRRSFVTVVPIAFLLILVESLYSLLAGRRGQARDVLAAIPWNLSRLDDMRRKRRQLRRVRTVDESAVRDLQVGGSARLAAFSRGQFSASQDRFSILLGSMRSSFGRDDARNVRHAMALGSVLAIILIFGSRHLLTGGVAPVGQIPDVGSPSILLREWLGGWRSVGTGGPGNAPSALIMLAFGRYLFFWAPGVFDTLLLVGPIFVAPIGIYRLARPIASPRAGAVGAVVYACNPLMVSALSAARWNALVIYAAAPFMLAALLRIGGYAPFGSVGGLAGPSVADRNLPVRLIRFGLLVAFVSAFAPSFVVVAVLAALCFALAAVALGVGGHPRDFALASAVAVVAPVALHGPWSFDVLQSISWRWLIGPKSPELSFDSLLELLRFAPGEPPARWMALGLVVAAVLAFVVVRAQLFHLAAQGWLLALVFLALVWTERRGWFPITLPTAEILLAPVAVGLTLVVIVGVRSLELDLTMPDSKRPAMGRLGWPSAVLGILAVASVFLVGLLSTVGGSWESPSHSFTASTEFLVDKHVADNEGATPGRVLWIGDQSVLPLDASVSASGIQYAVSDGGRADVRGRWSSGPVGATEGIGRQLDLARSGEVVRLGRLLAPYGIDHVVIVTQLAPAPYVGPRVDPGAGVEGALSQQLDLQGVPGVPNLLVFRNTSAGGLAPVLPDSEAALAASAIEQLDIDLASAPAPIVSYEPGKWQVTVPDSRGVLVGIPSGGIEVTGVRTETVSGFDDLTVIPAGPGGEVVLEYPPSLARRFALLGQLLLVAIGAILAQTRREGVV